MKLIFDKKEKERSLPLIVAFRALFSYPVIDYVEKYGESPDYSVAQGELYKPNKDPDRWFDGRVGERVVGCWDGYDQIAVYLGYGWFKTISKVKESPWTGQ